jgi:hypothetical protein
MLAAALVIAVPVAARGAEDPAMREAQARFEEGLARVKAGDFEAARMSFTQAYAVLHKPLILWNLALSEEKTGRSLDALAHFKQVVRDAAADADRANAQKHVDALMGQTGHVEVQAPAGAAIALDGGDAVGTAPLWAPLDVTPGHHVVGAKLGQGIRTLPVDAVAGQVARVSFTEGEPVAPLAQAAPVMAASASAGTPPQAKPLDPAQPADRGVTSQPFWTPRMVSTVALGGGAVVALGLGAYFGLQSQSNASAAAGFRASNASDACLRTTSDVCKQWSDAVDAQNRDATISDVFYVAGGVLALGALVSWFAWPKEPQGAAAWVLPMVGPGSAGLSGGGRF